MSRSAKELVCQVAAGISWHREPGPHIAECSGAVGTICGTEAVEDIQTAVQTPRIPTAG